MDDEMSELHVEELRVSYWDLMRRVDEKHAREAMKEHRYTLNRLGDETRYFRLNPPIEIVRTTTVDGDVFECRELGVRVGEGEIDAAWIAAYDKLMGTDDEMLSRPSVQLKQKLAASVTETRDGPPLNPPAEEVPTDKSKLKRYLVDAGVAWESGGPIAYMDTLPEAIEKAEAAGARRSGGYDYVYIHDLQEGVSFCCDYDHDAERFVWSKHDADWMESEPNTEEGG